jgi:organic hydroperoxide reductase OsmC/OhrA
MDAPIPGELREHDPMPHPFPHTYTAELDVKDDATAFLKAPPRPALVGGNPPEFDGNAEWWSPEHLLLSALQLCFRGTWTALSAKPGIKAKSFKTTATARIEKTTAGIVFTEIRLKASVAVAADQVEAAKGLLEKAKKYCIISNQLKTEPTLELDVRAG